MTGVSTEGLIGDQHLPTIDIKEGYIDIPGA